MADAIPTTPSPIVDAIKNETAQFKPNFEDQVISYASLYTLALICVIWGSIRSLSTVKRLQKKKTPIETSIQVKNAIRFPLTASLVLFGLYVLFRGNEMNDLVHQRVFPHIPEQYHPYVDQALSYVYKNATNGTEPGRLAKLTQSIRDLHPKVDEYYSYLPAFNKENIIGVLLYLITFEGITCFASLLRPLFSAVLRRIPVGNHWPRVNMPYFFVIKYGKKEMEEGDIEFAPDRDTTKFFEIEFDDHFLIALFFCMPIAISHLYRRHWITNNIIGVSFSIIGIETLHLASFKAGAILLVGLFFYDIFWVFGTDVMTTVAKSIDAPILLMVPQDLIVNGWLNATKHGMLGLGDIVIPGIFLALLHRFDNHIIDNGKKEKKTRYYFVATIIAYMAGLFLTIGIMHVYKAAQPALLYLVPCCLLTPLLLALIRGEVSQLFNYTEYTLTSDYATEKAAEKKAVGEKKTN